MVLLRWHAVDTGNQPGSSLKGWESCMNPVYTMLQSCSSNDNDRNQRGSACERVTDLFTQCDHQKWQSISYFTSTRGISDLYPEGWCWKSYTPRPQAEGYNFSNTIPRGINLMSPAVQVKWRFYPISHILIIITGYFFNSKNDNWRVKINNFSFIVYLQYFKWPK